AVGAGRGDPSARLDRAVPDDGAVQPGGPGGPERVRAPAGASLRRGGRGPAMGEAVAALRSYGELAARVRAYGKHHVLDVAMRGRRVGRGVDGADRRPDREQPGLYPGPPPEPDADR